MPYPRAKVGFKGGRTKEETPIQAKRNLLHGIAGLIMEQPINDVS
jgi:hypothetical protein